MSKFLDRVKGGELLVSDGATGTYLQEHGLPPGGCPEEFNWSHPNVVQGMAAEYFAAGSDLVLTNSFGGSRYRLKEYGLGDRVVELNRLAADHARTVAPVEGFVLGSIGPTGVLLEPNGPATEEEMFSAFCEQVKGLSEGGVDGFCIETMFDLAEMNLAIRAVKDRTSLPVVATMVFDKGPKGYFTMMGLRPGRVAEELAGVGADVIGSNCGLAIGHMVEIVTAMRAASVLPILTHVNAGIPEIKKTAIVYPDSPEFMAEEMVNIIEAGANIVGGCCGTSPEYIRAFARRYKS
tara:strand:+ start:1941 stop:2819 length:879 start_codon:yes stop_codon:yes gene_type:complete